MSEELQQKLRDQLWEVANKLRGNMSASDFMYFTLGFIFYKYLSEKIEAYANNALVDDEVSFKELWTMEDEDAAELQEELKKQCLEGVGYFIEPTYLFSSVIDRIKKKENILPILERSLKRIEDSTLGHDSEEDFGGLFSDIDLASPKLGKTADDKNTLVSNVLLALDDIKFGVEASEEIDILGDAYEYMIGQFAAGAGKKAGEFYTPQEVSQILAEIVSIGHARLRNVYDPTCGSGSLLLRAAKVGHAVDIYGQEKNPTTYNLARMNMLLHGIKFSNFKIENGDTLEWDAFGDTQFDAVVANPPFSAEWSAADKFNNDDRFSKAGRLAPKKTADYAFILHMIYHLNEGGTMACVAPHGVLFRGNAEGVIRRFLIEKKNYIKHAYQLFLFLGRGYEMVTKRDQSYNTHLVRGVHKFFFQYAKRRSLITTHTDHDKYPNNRIMYVEKDYIKLLDYSSGIIPKEMIRTWMKIAKQYDFKLTQSETKLWFK